MGKDIKVLLLVGGAAFHDRAENREILSEFIGAKFDLTMTDDMGVLDPDSLDAYDVIVNFTTLVEPTDEQVDALLEAVKDGKGFVAIHGAVHTFRNSQGYVDMVGGKIGSEDPHKEFLVQMSTAKRVVPHPITEGVEDFTIQDELFLIEGDMTKWQALARAEGHIVLYNKMYGKGRVHYNALGHDARALNNPAFQTLVVNGIKWAGGSG
jgi:type 1 glutamine amidotransferase